MPIYRHRTKSEKQTISKTLKKYYSQYTVFMIVKPRNSYVEPYNYKRKTQFILEKFEKYKIPRKNKQAIREYYSQLEMNNRKVGTIYKETQNLHIIFKRHRKLFDKMTKKDIENIVTRINNKEISEATKGIQKSTLRKFFRSLNKPELVEWIKVNLKSKEEQYLDIKDIKRIINKSESFEEKVFLSLLWEGCFRVGELLSLKRENIKIDNGTLFLGVKGKTGYRITPILKKGKIYPLGSYSLFRQYLKIRSENQVWSAKSYNQIEYRFKRLKQKTRLPFIHAHLFRKSRATYLDQIGIPSNHISVFGGWKINSLTLNTYILTGGRHLIPYFKKVN